MNGRRLAAALQTARIIHVAMMSTVLLYGVVLWKLADQKHGPHDLPAPATTQYFAMGACFVAGAVLVAMGTMGIARARQSGDPHTLAARLQSPMILRLAGAEVIALGGFTATFMSQMQNWVPYGIAAPIAIVAMAAFFPRSGFFDA